MKIFKFEEVNSTQDLAKNYLKQKRSESAAFIADSQINGYGKQGRFFYSPDSTGIYFSVALSNFEIVQEKISRLTPLISVKIIHVFKKYFPEVQFKIKWVNDVYVNDKKIAGILTEQWNNGLIIGVGINLTTTVFPFELKQKVGRITDSLTNVDKQEMIQNLIEAVDDSCRHYQSEDFLLEYKSLSYVLNNDLVLQIGKTKLIGRAIDFDNDINLILQTIDGYQKVGFGEVVKVNLL